MHVSIFYFTGDAVSKGQKYIFIKFIVGHELVGSWVKVQNFQNPELLKFKFLTLQYAFKILIFQV